MNISQELLDYFEGDTLAANTWLHKYAAEGEKTPDDMHRRMAKEFARIEKEYGSKKVQEKWICSSWNKGPLDEDTIYNLFKNFKYVIPAGSVMASLGTDNLTSLSNCFVVDSPTDSYSSIMKTREQQIHLMKRRGGVGYSLDKLRPRGAKVNNSAKTSTGAASFMDVCSDITNEVAQLNRRGALMLTLDIRHPDVEEFITKKQDLTKVTGANVSVQVTDEFMKAVKENTDFILKFPIDTKLADNIDFTEIDYDTLYPITNDKGKEIAFFKKVKAKRVWDLLMKCAYNTAEPGIIFKDRMINYSPDGVYPQFRMIATNPCGEVPLGPLDSCRLMHINLTSFVIDPFTDKAKFDFDTYKTVVYQAMRLSDDLVDLEIEAINRILSKVDEEREIELWSQIKQTAIGGRRVGLGFTGLADTLAMLKLNFNGDKKTLIFIKAIMVNKFHMEFICTTDLAILRGTFLNYSKELEREGNDWYKWLKDLDINKHYILENVGRRNISWSTVAPTGTVSLMARTSSGIEPVFMPVYERKVKCTSDKDRVDFVDQVGEKYTIYPVVHTGLRKYVELHKYALKDDFIYEELDDDINKWTIKDWEFAYKNSPYYGSTSADISWRDRNEIQSIVQRYTTHSISSTINLPENTTLEEIKDIYMDAFNKGNKGQTIYRDNCRAGILTKANATEISNTSAPKRPKVLEAIYYQVRVKGETFIIIVGLLNNRPYEIFAFKPLNDINIPTHKGTITKIDKMHYNFSSEHLNIDNLELQNDNIEEKAATLYSSMLLRHGVDIEYIIKTAKKVNNNISSFSSAMCRVLTKFIKSGKVKGEVCPDCGGDLLREAGCIKCLDCSYSKCE